MVSTYGEIVAWRAQIAREGLDKNLPQIFRTLPCRPRCCESCNKRQPKGVKLRPWAVVYHPRGSLPKLECHHWLCDGCVKELMFSRQVESMGLIESMVQ
jgi:hypothetical protein